MHKKSTVNSNYTITLLEIASIYGSLWACAFVDKSVLIFYYFIFMSEVINLFEDAEEKVYPEDTLEWGKKYMPPWYWGGSKVHPFAAFERMQNIDYISTLRSARLYVSPRLQEDPLAYLDMQTEIAECLEQMLPDRRDNAELFQEDIEMAPTAKLKAIVGIPVAAQGEGTKLQHTLAEFARQTMPSDEWMLFLFVNQVDNPEGEAHSELIDNIMSDTRKKYPHLPLVSTYTTYGEAESIGNIRCDLWDTALVHLHKK